MLFWLAAAFALASGVPLYLLLDGLDRLSPALREFPSPLFALSAALAILSLFLAVRLRHTRHARIAAAVAMASPLLLMVFAKGTAARLPAQSRELLSGAPLPDAALVSAQKTPLRLADLRGEPLVLVVYRGSS